MAPEEDVPPLPLEEDGRRRRRALRRKMRIGLICGKEDGDLVRAPGIPEGHWVSSAVSEDYEDQEPFWLRETVHTDIAIWWYIKQHYAESVDAELLHGTDVTALRLAKNDVNILLGWDAVSAYLEEAQSEDDPKKNGYGAKMASLLRKPQSKIWPPASLRDLCDNKGDYLRYLEEKGIPIAPTYVYENNNTDVDEEKISSEEEKKKKKHPGPPMSAATQDAQPPKKRRRLDFLGHAYDLKQT